MHNRLHFENQWFEKDIAEKGAGISKIKCDLEIVGSSSWNASDWIRVERNKNEKKSWKHVKSIQNWG